MGYLPSENDLYKGNVLPVCSICNQVPALGIGGIIKIGRVIICQACEQEILRLEVGSPGYDIMLEKMRKVWK